jgi:hypothetical protein
MRQPGEGKPTATLQEWLDRFEQGLIHLQRNGPFNASLLMVCFCSADGGIE